MKIIQQINNAIKDERQQLLDHKLYNRILTVHDLRIFTEYHVYAVWDFMSLLKALQIELTCTKVPWYATASPDTRYLINEIVLAEESDVYLDGRRLSHYEMYLDAMRTLGADTCKIQNLLGSLADKMPVFQAIQNLEADGRVKAFLNYSFDLIEEGSPHKIASAFTFGREDLIPDMFTELLKSLQLNFPESDLTKIVYYFQRHIELDGDEHGPLAMRMIGELAGNDEQKWQEITDVAREALKRRIGLWDAIYDAILALQPADQ